MPDPAKPVVEPAKPAVATEPAKPAAAVTEPAPVVDQKELGRQEAKAELAKFTKTFGAAKGAEFYSAGKTYTEACEAHIAAQDAQITELKKTPATQPKVLGEAAPVVTQPAKPAGHEGLKGKDLYRAKLREKFELGAGRN